MESHCSAGSEDWILEPTEQASGQSLSARQIPTGERSSLATGQTSLASPMCEKSMWPPSHPYTTEASTSSTEDSPAKTSASPVNDEASQESDPLSSSSSPDSPMSLFGPEDGFWSRTCQGSYPAVPASDAASAGSFYDSIAKAGVSLASMPDELIASFVSMWALLMTAPWMAAQKHGIAEAVQAAARVAAATRPGASLPPTPAPSSRWSAMSSATSGFTTSPGECWTAVTSECPRGGGASSSSPDVLEADVPPRFCLSPRAAAGILRRAAKRERELPRPLAEALRDLASQHPDDGKRTTRTSSPERCSQTASEATSKPKPSSARSPEDLPAPAATELVPRKPHPAISSPTPS